jgi:hypothetical protein
VQAGGTFYRVDEVPLTLRPALIAPYPTDEAVLRALVERVARLSAGRLADWPARKAALAGGQNG